MLEIYFETVEYFWITSAFYFITAIIVFIILSVHTYNLCSDLCTSKRASLRHRSQLPPISPKYLTISILTQFTLFIFCISTTIAFFLRWKFMEPLCTIGAISATTAYTTAKGLMYILFVARLYSVYGSSAYKYPPKLLIFIVIINIIYCAVFVVILPLWTEIEVVHLSFADYIIFCQPRFPGPMVLAVGAYDFIFSVLFLIAFNWPLRKISQHRLRSNSFRQNCKSEQKMIATLIKLGTKSKILIWNAIISTLLHIVFVVVTDSPTSFTLDVIVNCICICLMTPYYPDSVYYYRLCSLCIRCCHDKTVMEHTVTPKITLGNVNSVSECDGEPDMQKDGQGGREQTNSKSIEV